MDKNIADKTSVKKKISETVANFWIDIVLFLAFVLDMNMHFTGAAIHEWLGIALGLSVIVHLLMHWQWISCTLGRLFKRTNGIQRLKTLVDLAMFIDFVMLVMTGILISEVVARQLGINFSPGMAWKNLHKQTADLLIYLMGAHLGLSWGWIVKTFKRIFRIKTGRTGSVSEPVAEGSLS